MKYEQESRRNLSTLFLPKAEIAGRIQYIAESLGINKKTIGIHARGTDMSGVNYKWYKDRTVKWYNTNKLFLSTESEEYLKKFQADFPNILTAPDTIYATKQQVGKWKQNLNISEEAMIHSVIDLFLLARTNIQVAWPASSFASVARIIGGN